MSDVSSGANSLEPDPDRSEVCHLPPRPIAGHKGTFGTVLIIGGCATAASRMVGAPALAALAAMGAFRAGAGLVKVLSPASILDAAITIVPSATGIALPVDERGWPAIPSAIEVLDRQFASCSACLIGPGMGTEGVAPLVLRVIQQEDAPLVIDADALNVLASIPDLWRDFRAASILTPHPGEFRRLAEAFKINHDPTDPVQRPRAAAALAQRLGCIVVLKGAGTVVSDGLKAWVCDRGSPSLATAGTGDVLGGLLVGLLAQYCH
ncbi:MAG: NAD(P)H-hydrate dehydratase, partial [bacterium]|nr:NAD(P)H-hydrate dehydratase [bacterium]